MRALAADPAHAKLHELLTIFSCRGLDDYTAFAAANGDFLASIGVAHEASLRTMRLLTLCSLASGKTSLSYDAIAAALAVSGARAARARCLVLPLASPLCAPDAEFSFVEIPR